ncbi:hypothetical protein H9Q72_012821 [Fusarium xylarioides]|uniref:Uncharacterized protein n=1 Tax=Fusarium xylarioides TaxID=221167 RepID=A0A9P7L2S8_9HYPO|nr:hypothetical protein H9Q70_014404 [Fusarium xylarioides]KAG5759053.1 hypothetical protein H9Q72_012821 [Fusarium xylarioides]KAG5771040.1 hypothetical protein H9Q73_012994 [Fusarium xylarioides]
MDSELHTPKAGGSSFLRNLARLAKKALRPGGSRRVGSKPGEAQRFMGRHLDGLKLFVPRNDVQTENRLKRIEGDVARIAAAVGRLPYHVPECVRRLAGANLTAEEMQELETRHVAE